LGYSYQTGAGVGKNLVEAYAWTSLSAGQGYSNAIEEMPTLESLLTSGEKRWALDRANFIAGKIAKREPVPDLDSNQIPSLQLPPVKKAEPSLRDEVIISQANGTGYFITSEGYVLTCYHVVKGAQRVSVKTTDPAPMSAKIVATDVERDLALLLIDARVGFKARPVSLARENPRLGESVFTIGYPNADIQGLSPKVTDGKISSTAGLMDDPSSVQVSVPVQPGNSGGPLINLRGEVVGTIQSTLAAEWMLRQNRKIPQNVSYAVKTVEASKLLEGIHLPFPEKLEDAQDKIDILPQLVERAMASVVLILVE
jgi:S1-C subfamily serine protease